MAIKKFPKGLSGIKSELYEQDRVSSAFDLRASVSRDIFDPEIFEELRELFGEDRTRLALEELSSCLQDSFPNVAPEELDRDQIFRRAHFLVARAGLMGFTALRDTCADLQQACAKGSPFGKEYSRTLETTTATRNAIASLL